MTLLTYTRLASRAVLSFVSRLWFSQLVCWNTVHMESGLDGVSCLWKSLYMSGQNLSVKLSDYVNDDGSILLSTVQTELIENQLIIKMLKSVHTVGTTGMFPLLEGNDINLLTTVFPVIEGVSKRNFERNKKVQDGSIMRVDISRSVVKFSILDFVERTCVGLCKYIFLLDRAQPWFCEHTGGNFSRV